MAFPTEYASLDIFAVEEDLLDMGRELEGAIERDAMVALSLVTLLSGVAYY